MTRPPELTPRQHRAAVELAGRSVALTSGAGCGKTLVLARRFTELIFRAGAGGEDRGPLDRLVALTFTEKAAAEMNSRVRTVLLDRLAESRDGDERRRLAEWITELPAAHISTIHSFCASLLRLHAVEAGVDPDFTVGADELVMAQMLAAAVEKAVLSAVEAGADDVLDLLVRAGLWRVHEDVAVLVGRRMAWRAEDYADPEKAVERWAGLQKDLRPGRIAAFLDDPARRGELDYLLDYPCDNAADRLLIWRDEHLSVILRMLDRPDSVTRADLERMGGSPGNAGGAQAWGGKEAMMAYRRRLKDFVAGFAELRACFEPLGEADADAARCLAALTRLAGQAGAEYAAAKRAAGMLDFDDLIDLTARLLRENDSVRSALRDGLDQLLLDECQDTDAVQLEMLGGLVSEGRAPAPGKLFIVGDPKQSIYRFRGARAEVFARLCESFADDGRISLNRSFRVHPAGAAFVNRVFAEMMGRDYEPIVSARPDPPPRPSVEILLAECDRADGAAGGTIAQADLVARRIAEMIGREKLVLDRRANRWREVRPGDIAILFARMTASDEYERALRQRELDYYVVAGSGFFRQQEVFDVLNALRAIDNPLDDVALFGVLRSAMFGLDDNVLLHVAGAADPPYFGRLLDPAVLDRLDPAKRGQLVFAATLLGRLHRAKDALGPAGLIDELLEATGFPAVLASQFHGRRKLGNVRRLAGAARSAQAAGGVTLADFVRRCGEFSLTESRYEQAAVAGPADDAVRIMTIHKAKGLEFPVVIIPDLNAGRRGVRERMLFRDDWGITFKPPDPLSDEEEGASAGDGPVSHRIATSAETDELLREDVRKLYVAATRHQDHLIFVGADLRSTDGDLLARGSYLARLDEVLGFSAAIDAGEKTIDCGDGYLARVEKISPVPPPRRGSRRRPAGERIVAEAETAPQVARGLTGAAEPGGGALVGPLPAEGAAGTIAPTALADFEYCPMLYRWRHELRVPSPAPAAGSSGRSRPDAATCGTIFHRCMELVDFEALAAGDDPADHAGALIAGVLAEMELPAEPGPLVADLTGMLAALRRAPLLERIRGAGLRLGELTFLHRAGPFDVSGQIDLLLRDGQGRWGVIDYKSDRLEPDQAPAHARRYELQMLLYASAAARHLGAPPADATVYFLRPGVSHRFEVSQAVLGDLDRRLAELARRLIGARRTGRFARRGDRDCDRCPLAQLCRRPAGDAPP